MEFKDCQQQNIPFSQPPLWKFLLFSCVKTTTKTNKQTKKSPGFFLRTVFPSQSSREIEGIVVIAGLGGGLVILLPLLAVFIKFYTLSFKNTQVWISQPLSMSPTTLHLLLSFLHPNYSTCVFQRCLILAHYCSIHTTPILILGDFSAHVLDPDSSQVP